MRGNIRIVFFLCIGLLICVLIGQGGWLYKTRKMEINRFRQEAGDRLVDSFKEFLDKEWVTRKVPFSYGLKEDKKTFVYGDSCRVREITLSFVDQFEKLGRAVFYDYLYEQHNFDVFQLDSLYRKNLEKTGMNGLSGILLRDSAGRVLEVTGVCEGEIRTVSVEAGYRCRHRIEAVFQLPLIFRSMVLHLVWEGVFLFAFIGCLIWLWKTIRLTWQSANVQTMGIAHLEHELKKPLAAITSALEGIVNRKNRELTAIQEEKLKMVEVRIRKMAEITDTMLVTLKNSRLEVERASVDIVQEIGMVAEMFRILYPYARLEFQVETGEEKPLLDQVYFNYLVINLVDNAIKYGGDEPWVKVVFYRENWDWVLTVTDRGIGMPERVLKRIFRQFYRVKDKKVKNKTGFGLGLAFVKKVVNAYGGEIRVESAPGKGSRFEVRIKAE